MKFSSEQEHDELNNQHEATENTALLAKDTEAPTTDPEVAEAPHQPKNTPSSPIVQNGQLSTPPRPNGKATRPSIKDLNNRPLPVTQILLLCLARLVEPIAFFSIFPFINQFIQHAGHLLPSRVGFYSGLIESLFALTQTCTLIVWGRLSDRYGRKPILVISLLGCSVTVSLFGFAESIPEMIVYRCLAGFFAGTVVTIRTMISELSTQRTQARAFSWFAFSSNMGILLGPLLGGALADPRGQYGWQGRLFERFPYALATTATGGIALLGAIVTILFVRETMPEELRKPSGKKDDSEAEPEVNGNGNGLKKDDEGSMWALLKAPGVVPVLYLYAHIMVLAASYTAIVPVFWYTPVDLGGFGFSFRFISIFMAITGAAQAVWLLLIFPPLQHRIWTGGVLRWCAIAYPFFFAVCPALNLLRREGSHATDVAFWVLAPISLCMGVGVSMCFTAIQLALNDVSPSPKTLGTLNALALTLSTAMRAICPAAFTSLFAIGVTKQILNGYLVWVVMIVVAVGLVLALRWLPEAAEGKLSEEVNED